MPKKTKHLHLNVENTAIDQVSHLNFLGLTITEQLNWKSHLDKLSNKTSKTTDVLNKFNILFL